MSDSSGYIMNNNSNSNINIEPKNFSKLESKENNQKSEINSKLENIEETLNHKNIDLPLLKENDTPHKNNKNKEVNTFIENSPKTDEQKEIEEKNKNILENENNVTMNRNEDKTEKVIEKPNTLSGDNFDNQSQNSYIYKKNCFMKINRFLNNKKKEKISVFLLLYSSAFLIISTIDLILRFLGKLNNSKNNVYYNNNSASNNKNNEIIMNNLLVFIFQMIYFFLFFIFIGINILFGIEEKKEKIILIIIEIIMVYIIVSRIVFYIKNSKVLFMIFINILFSLLNILLNIFLLVMLSCDKKKKKNTLRNIDDIINFTDVPAELGKSQSAYISKTLINDKKKEGVVALVDDEAEPNKK